MNYLEQSMNSEINRAGPFRHEPKRSSLLNVVTHEPFNAETPAELICDYFITSNYLHFVRGHLPVPFINFDSYILEIENEITDQNTSLNLSDLKLLFSKCTLAVTIQCAGNRRSGMHLYKAIQEKEQIWGIGAISTAEWTGVKLEDILDYCGVDLKDDQIKHIQFIGHDRDADGSHYGASIPKEKLLNQCSDVLIAFQMNGEDLPLDHGFPLRVVIPGVIGARSVKWLHKIVLSSEENKSHWQQNEYKMLPPELENLNLAFFKHVKALQECPVQSAICHPLDGAVVDREANMKLNIRGYAYSGGGNSIDQVLVSIDDGNTWKTAILSKLNQPLYKEWTWTLWDLDIELPKEQSSLKITCVATDSNKNTQPESMKSIWNLKGLLNNSWHAINIHLK